MKKKWEQDVDVKKNNSVSDQAETIHQQTNRLINITINKDRKKATHKVKYSEFIIKK